MRVLFWYANKPRERLLAEAFCAGVQACGDHAEMREKVAEPELTDEFDAVGMVGVKSAEMFRAYWGLGVHTLYFDKGYERRRIEGPIRRTEYWRIAVDAHNPTKFLSTARHKDDRWRSLGYSFKPWRVASNKDHVLIAGSSEKYHAFYGLPHPTAWAKGVIDKIHSISERRIVYRPKPSWHEATPIDGAHFSHRHERRQIGDDLTGCHALVTHGSNACFEAVLAGVPCVILGEGVAKPISSVRLDDVEQPRLASDAERQQWLNNLAYCQWTFREMASGEMWQHTREQVLR